MYDEYLCEQIEKLSALAKAETPPHYAIGHAMIGLLYLSDQLQKHLVPYVVKALSGMVTAVMETVARSSEKSKYWSGDISSDGSTYK